MRVLGVGEKLEAAPASAVTIGVYDGVHQGHRWLLRRLRKAAGPNTPLVVVTFDPHPLAVIRPVAVPKTLTSTARKLEILGGLGFVDACVVVPFDESRREQGALDFVEEVLVEQLGAASVMVGTDFRFGHDREGDLALLRTVGERRGFLAHGAPLLPVSSAPAATPCSSTHIRGLIRRGKLAEAGRLLGRPHQVDGTVAAISRPRTGRGVPTVVLRVDRAAALPVEGSYLGALTLPDGRRHVAGVSIRQGVVAGPQVLVDAHLSSDFACVVGADLTIELQRPLWAAGRTELAGQVTIRAAELGQASADSGWGAAG